MTLIYRIGRVSHQAFSSGSEGCDMDDVSVTGDIIPGAEVPTVSPTAIIITVYSQLFETFSNGDAVDANGIGWVRAGIDGTGSGGDADIQTENDNKVSSSTNQTNPTSTTVAIHLMCLSNPFILSIRFMD